jgi:hypothetical protein
MLGLSLRCSPRGGLVKGYCIFSLALASQAYAIDASNRQEDSHPFGSSSNVTTEESKVAKPLGQRIAAIWDRTLEDPVAFYTFVLSIFTALLALVSGTQIYFLIRADSATRQTLVLTQRPRVRVRNIVVNPHNRALVHRIGLFQPDHPVAGQFYLSNVGGTGARITDSLCVVFWSESGLPMRRPYEDAKANAAVANARLEPDQSAIGTFSSSDSLDARGNTVGSNTIHALRLFVMGWVEYRDDIGVTRRTAFCHEFQRRGGFAEGRFYPVDDRDYEHEE